ncbi:MULTISPECIES: cellulase family glycosylhydrolase [unclassified Agarivorans]|uniref:cellulase family glycosylhydrolase n=1 Tax=unclassified Agarivorans TaxID=2636026 RepID=UPI0026E3B866|nr:MULTISPECIES: cellulase family glycosylhydrolase [unclassified Agarivorans]MDO6684202.1 cellulase family glycosylhydrolase [Agarivorans sp. 3_MG-2023]MDO6714064.1 cellulase family glycosylhydrolase [Agarivorans sp. 2_MG-2023]
MMNTKKSFLTKCLGFTAASLVSASLMAAPLPGDDWLHVEGNQIKDMQGNTVWLTGANWFGFNTTERVLHGLWSVNLENTIQDIASRGVNLLRVPISTELLKEWKNGQFVAIQVNASANPDLASATSLEVFDAMIAAAKASGMKILLDVHGAEADNMGHIAPLWYKGDITSEDFFSTWEWVTERYKNDDTIIAFDLENEPHGNPKQSAAGEFAKWDNSTDENNWKHACEVVSNRVLDINPNMLVMCEGIEAYPVEGKNWESKGKDDFHFNWWGGNLRGVREFPIDLGARQQQFMYSPHDYGPLVFEQEWFYPGFNKDTLYQDVWKDNWMFIHEEGISPLLIGEWGGFMDGGPNEAWMVAIRDLIIEHQLHHTFWCINPNSGDTGGLLGHDWTTWDEEKYALFLPSLWVNDAGKFISLDHEVALGGANSATGISLNDYYQGLNPSVSISSPAANSIVLTGSSFSVSYSVNKAASVNVYLDGSFVKTGPVSGGVNLTAPSAEGDFTVSLVAVNSAGSEMAVSDSITLSALNEVPLQPEISVSSPNASSRIEAASTFTVSVNLKDATGFETNLAGQVLSFTGTSAELTAPSVVGAYTLKVTAQDEQGQNLSVSDSVALNVVEPAAANLSCTVGPADSWGSGFVINSITVSNTGTETISGWTAVLDFPSAVSLVGGWGGVFTATAQSIEVTNEAYNTDIAPGSSLSFGLQGGHSGNFGAPTCTMR